MNAIQQIDLIREKVQDFTMSDFKYIVGVSYQVNIDTVNLFDVYNRSTLEIQFVLVSKAGNRFKVTLRFGDVNSLNLYASGTTIQLSGFEVLDIRDSGWESANFLVRDFENEEIKFYCKSVEVTTFEDCDWIE